MWYSPLHDRSVIALSGEDVIAFLQGLITQDANKLAQGEMLYACLLSQQGKFLHDFFLIPQSERILLDVNKERAADLMARLAMYKLRSKVMVEATDIKVTAMWSENTSSPRWRGELEGGDSMIVDPRINILGHRLYQSPPFIPPQAGKEEWVVGDYEAHRIALGVPDGAKDMHADKSLLLQFGLDKLNGVSFSKGCYVGQEVTARSKFRGQVRKALYCVSADSALPPLGTGVTSAGHDIGELRSVSGTIGLALLKSDELEKITAPLLANDVPLTVTKQV